jgi:4-amino-4-deoxychorismate lyase
VTLLAVAVGGRGVVPVDQPVLLADDEAVLRGRAVFETTRVYGGRPFLLDRHLTRMQESARRVGLAWPGGFDELAAEALAEAGVPDAALRLYLTPGREGSGETVSLALVSSLPAGLEQRRARGVRLVSLLGVRAEAPWLLGGVKSTSYAVNMAAEAEARRRGADDAVFVRDDGVVLEGPVTNLWWRVGRTLHTPAVELGILAGITRAAVLRLARGRGYDVREGAFPLADLHAAEEAFSTSSIRELMPVAEIDGHRLGRGPAADELQAALREAALGQGAEAA